MPFAVEIVVMLIYNQHSLTSTQWYKTEHISEYTDRDIGKYIHNRVLFQKNGGQADENGCNHKSNMQGYVFFAFQVHECKLHRHGADDMERRTYICVRVIRILIAHDSGENIISLKCCWMKLLTIRPYQLYDNVKRFTR